jgi:hypothetical protein
MYGRSNNESVNSRENSLEDQPAGSAVVFTPDSLGAARPRKRPDINAERQARYETTNREIDRLVAEAHARLPRHLAKVVGAIYVRFSTWMQDSAEDQVRTILNFAVENGIFNSSGARLLRPWSPRSQEQARRARSAPRSVAR